MCDVNIAMCIFNTNGKKWAEFTTLPFQTLLDMYNNIPRKDISVFGPCIDPDKDIDDQKITPVEWTDSTKEKLIKSAELIRKRKEDGRNKSDNQKKRNKKNISNEEEGKFEEETTKTPKNQKENSKNNKRRRK